MARKLRKNEKNQSQHTGEKKLGWDIERKTHRSGEKRGSQEWGCLPPFDAELVS